MEIMKIPDNGYYVEAISSSLVLETYHTTYITFNLSIIHNTLAHLFVKHLIREGRLKKSFPKNTNLKFQLNHSYKQLDNAFINLQKLKHGEINQRKRRGLINFLGSSIKFVTGNLDHEDLNEINSNFKNIRMNQIKTMHKLNQLSSFAGHVTDKFQTDLFTVYNHTQTLKQAMNNISNLLDFVIQIQDHSLQILIITDSYINKLLNTVTFAMTNTLDIELFNLDELKQIWTFLKSHYSSYQLWPLNQIYELISICKTG